MQFSFEYDLDKDSKKLLILLIFTDIVFIVFHCLHYYTGLLPGSLFSLLQERGYAEIYQHIKELWIVLLLFILALTRFNFLYLAWSLLFVYILLDDSLQIHERGGSLLAHYFSLQPLLGLSPGAVGQLLVFISFAVFLFSIIGVFHYLNGGHDRKVSKYLFILIAFLAFFGIVIDITSEIFSKMNGIDVIVEEGGEMFVMSIITWYVFSVNPPAKEINI